MPEMLPCPLSMSRYQNKHLDNNSYHQDATDYLDPSNDSDYELISQLRHGILQQEEDFDSIQPYTTVTVEEIEAAARR